MASLDEVMCRLDSFSPGYEYSDQEVLFSAELDAFTFDVSCFMLKMNA
jgi:hypothetical protein